MVRFARILSLVLCGFFIVAALASLIAATPRAFLNAFGAGLLAYSSYRAFRGLRADSDANSIGAARSSATSLAASCAVMALLVLFLGFGNPAVVSVWLAVGSLCFAVVAIGARQRANEFNATMHAERDRHLQALARFTGSAALGDHLRGVAPPTEPASTEPAATKPAFYLSRPGLPVPLNHPARSYFGGLPRLPAELKWPDRSEDGETWGLTFVAQIDLEEVAAQGGSALPTRGTLYFFYSAGIEYIEDDDTSAVQVLYYPERADALPLTPAPSTLHPYGFSEQWPWLKDIDTESRIAFKFPISFTPFTSRCDYEGIGKEQAFEHMDEQLRAKLPCGDESAPSLKKAMGESSTAWPFNWAGISHISRAAISAMDDMRDYSMRTAPEPAKEALARVRARAADWLERAAAEGPLDACDATTAAEFREHWQALKADVERVAKEAGVTYPARLQENFFGALQLSCYLAASSENEAERQRIPEEYRAALENEVRWHTGHKGRYRVNQHQMLGFGWSVQSAPQTYADEVLLLQITGDDLSWFPDWGCVLQIWIDADALEARSFDVVYGTLECD